MGEEGAVLDMVSSSPASAPQQAAIETPPVAPRKSLVPKALTQVLKAHCKLLSEGDRVTPVLLTIVFPPDSTSLQDAWQSVEGVRQKVMSMFPIPAISWAIISIETHPGSSSKKAGKKRPRGGEAGPEADDLLGTPPLEEQRPQEQGLQVITPAPTQKKNPLEGFPHLHLLLMQDQRFLQPDVEHSRRLVQELFPSADINIQAKPRMNDGDLFRMLRYVLKGWNCPLTSRNLAAYGSESVQKTTLLGPFLHDPPAPPIPTFTSTCSISQVISNWLRAMAAPTGCQFFKTSFSVNPLLEPTLVWDLQAQFSTNPRDLLVSQIANYMRMEKTFYYKESFYYSNGLQCLRPFSSTDRFIQYLLTVPEIRPNLLKQLEWFRSNIGLISILFPVPAVNDNLVRLEDGVYDIATNTATTQLAPGQFYLRFLSNAALVDVSPSNFIGTLRRHLLHDPQSPQDQSAVLVDLLVAFGQLFHRRPAKLRVPVMVGPPNCAKTTVLSWIYELFDADRIGNCNSGDFPFSDFVVGERSIFIFEDFNCSKARFSDLLRFLEGGEHVPLQAKNHNTVNRNINIPGIITANGFIQYSTDKTGAVNARTRYFHFGNPLPLAEVDNVGPKQAIKREAYAILRLCNTKYLERNTL